MIPNQNHEKSWLVVANMTDKIKGMASRSFSPDLSVKKKETDIDRCPGAWTVFRPAIFISYYMVIHSKEYSSL